MSCRCPYELLRFQAFIIVFPASTDKGNNKHVSVTDRHILTPWKVILIGTESHHNCVSLIYNYINNDICQQLIPNFLSKHRILSFLDKLNSGVIVVNIPRHWVAELVDTLWCEIKPD